MQEGIRWDGGGAPRPGIDRPLTVSELNASIRSRLEGSFPRVWLSGELSDVTIHASGHVYFTLKDGQSQLRGAAFRYAMEATRLGLARGMAVEAFGRISVYEPRGEYQLVAGTLRPAGAGEEARRLEELRAKLAAEGLFDPSRKRPIPALPRVIGLITAPTGAAIQDFLRNLRCPLGGVHVRLVPSLVQGAEAPRKLMAALDYLDRHGGCDVIVITRGGGSSEDLAAFNDEALVRAVASSATPVLSAVGHDRDRSLCDLAADGCESTPTGAAARVVRGKLEYCARVTSAGQRLAQSQQSRVAWLRQRLDRAGACRLLQRPDEWLERLSQRLDMDSTRLQHALPQLALRQRQRLESLSGRLRVLGVRLSGAAHARLEQAARRLEAQGGQLTATRTARLERCGALLSALNPRGVLSRGYSILLDPSGRAVRAPDDVRPGDELRAILRGGDLSVRVLESPTTTAEEQ